MPLISNFINFSRALKILLPKTSSKCPSKFQPSIFFAAFARQNLFQQNAKFSEAGIILKKMVGAARFELATSCAQGRRASQATLRPDRHPSSHELPAPQCFLQVHRAAFPLDACARRVTFLA